MLSAWQGSEKDARQGVMWIFKAARQGFHASLEILLNIPGEGNPAGQVALEDVKTILRHDIQQGKDAGKNEEMLQMIVKSESENKQKLSELASLEEAAKKETQKRNTNWFTCMSAGINRKPFRGHPGRLIRKPAGNGCTWRTLLPGYRNRSKTSTRQRNGLPRAPSKERQQPNTTWAFYMSKEKG